MTLNHFISFWAALYYRVLPDVIKEFRFNCVNISLFYRYYNLALTNDVVIISRSHGSYRLVPVRESDTLIDQTTLEAKIRRGIEEYEQGKVHKMEEGESVDGFLSRMINED